MPRINKPWFTRIDYTMVVILALYSASQVLPFGAFDVFYPGWQESYVDLHEFVDPWDGFTSSYVEIFGWYMLPVMIARHLATPLSWLGFACLALGHWWRPTLMGKLAGWFGLAAASTPTACVIARLIF